MVIAGTPGRTMSYRIPGADHRTWTAYPQASHRESDRMVKNWLQTNPCSPVPRYTSPMALFVLTTHGSSGDLNPFLALASGLQTRGHQVRFALSPPLARLARDAGFPVQHLAADAPFTAPEAVYNGGSAVNSLKAAIQQGILPTLRQKVEDLRAACAGADALVAASLQLPASLVADLTGLPWASVAVAPLAIPSAAFPPSPLPWAPPPLRPVMNRIAWRIGAQLLDPIADPAVNALRDSYGLAPRRHLLLTGNLSSTLVAVAVSPAFLPQPADWPPHARTTGFCFDDGTVHWHEPPELTAFLATTEPVIAVSSGSQSADLGATFADFYRTSRAAIARIGARALILGASPGTLGDPPPPHAFVLPYAPFSRVYPRCAAVIHHGGIGTVAHALRAGVPMLVAPWGFDQFFNADRVVQLGAGRRLDRRAYDKERVTAELVALLGNASYRTTAQALAAQLAQEDGVGTLCDALEALLAPQPAPTRDP